MPDPFAAAIDALYASPMAVAGVFTPEGGLTATPIQLIRALDSVEVSGGDIVQDRHLIKFRRSDIDAPAEGDIITIGLASFIIHEEPLLDVEGLEWTVGIAPLPA
jgi:hypothetical protein